MKKLLIFSMILLLLLSLFSCNKTKTANTDISESFTPTAHEINTSVLSTWTGKFSEEKLKIAINEYKNNYENFVLSKNDTTSSVSFNTDFEASSCSIRRLSPANDDNINSELMQFIDLFIEPDVDGKKITIPIDWWTTSTSDGWVKKYPVWSYLVCAEDSSGTEHYYYFRVDYSALIK